MRNKKKMLQLCAVGFTVEKLLLPLIDGMEEVFDVTTVCSYDETTDRLTAKGYNIVNINIERGIRPLSNLRSIIVLCKHMKKEKYDVVHVHTPVAAILGRIAAKLAKVPVVIYTAHGFYFHDEMPKLKKKIFIQLEKFSGKISDYIFTQSQEDCNTAIKEGIISKEKIITIGNGVDINKFKKDTISKDTKNELRNEFNIGENDLVIAMIGRVVAEKGYRELVYTMHKLVNDTYKTNNSNESATAIYKENIKLLCIGQTLESDRDGIKNELDEYIIENNLQDNIIFAGSRSDVPEILSITDIFAFPSYREGMPRSIIEAMCMELPVIATNIRGCREEVVEGKTGFIIPIKNYGVLAEKIKLLIDNKELRIKMGENGRNRALELYDESKVIQIQKNKIIELLNN